MTFHLSEDALQLAIEHLETFGDTDVFPHLPELHFLTGSKAAVISELKRLDLDNYSPNTAVEVLSPKGQFAFRVVHQIPFVENVLFLAAVCEIAEQIERARCDDKTFRAFSYRFERGPNGQVFRTDRTFKMWNEYQQELIHSDFSINSVIETDISDFYSRINFHRLDNLLDEVAPKHGAVRFIKKVIKAIRAKQSFGIPVGGTAARLLAELALVETDRTLEMHGLLCSRYVDDFRIFIQDGDDPYEALAFLAQHLSIREGLPLNRSKTSVHSREDYISRLENLSRDVGDIAENDAFDALISNIYLDDHPDPEDLEKLKNINILGYLVEELEKVTPDLAKIRLLFRAIRLAKPYEAINFIVENLKKLLIYTRDLVLSMHELGSVFKGCFSKITDEIVLLVTSPPASSIELIQSWLLDLFVKGTVPINAKQCARLEAGLSSPLHRRQLLLIRGRLNDRSYFGSRKTSFSTISPFEQTCFIWGASCLPQDEFETWIGNIRGHLSAPTSGLFLEWAKSSKERMMDLLHSSAKEHED